MRIYVGNLPYSASQDDLYELFEEFGRVEDANVVTDRDTGRARGFGFVTMPNDQEARRAIEELNGTEFGGRALTINEAKPRAEGGARGHGGGARGGGAPRGQGGGHGRGRW